ncbi:MAG TPA: type II secretion system F family protein [Candidatus Nitrosotenuis sp.]|jgi:type IV pilus assembly protein PilC|nr:type II secretion system F family protein [Candidatus Nitrosotenuis sp.]
MGEQRTFEVEAFGRDGTVTRAQVRATTKVEAMALMESRGLIVARIVETAVNSPAAGPTVAESAPARGRRPAAPTARMEQPLVAEAVGWWERLRGVPRQEVVLFLGQLRTMRSAGVPLGRALEAVARQTPRGLLRNALIDVLGQVRSGRALSEGLARHPGIFSPILVAVIRAGESGGILDLILNRLVLHEERDLKMSQRLRAAMTYPATVFAGAVLVVFGLMQYLLGGLVTTLRDLGVELPLSTRILLFVVTTLRSPWAVLGGLAGLYFLGRWLIRLLQRPGMRGRIDAFLLRLPVFGHVLRKVAVARLCRSAASLLDAGLPLVPALQIVEDTLSNRQAQEAVAEIRQALREGVPLGKALGKTGFFPRVVTQMLSVGEDTGSVPAMMAKVADYYETEVESALEGFTAAIEPLMISFLGLVVAFIVIATFSPLYGLIARMGQ